MEKISDTTLLKDLDISVRAHCNLENFFQTHMPEMPYEALRLSHLRKYHYNQLYITRGFGRKTLKEIGRILGWIEKPKSKLGDHLPADLFFAYREGFKDALKLTRQIDPPTMEEMAEAFKNKKTTINAHFKLLKGVGHD